MEVMRCLLHVSGASQISSCLVMGTQEWAVLAAAVLNSLQQAAITLCSAKITHGRLNPFFAVAVTAGAGLIVAAALGGTLLLSLRKQQKGRPLGPRQWCTAFDAPSGCLINCQKMLEKVRFGGIEPRLRSDVWPFLLGFYDLNSTQEERESEKCRKRDLYEDLKLRCTLLRTKISEDVEGCDDSNEGSEMSCEISDSSQNMPRSVTSDPEGPAVTGSNREDTYDDSRNSSSGLNGKGLESMPDIRKSATLDPEDPPGSDSTSEDMDDNFMNKSLELEGKVLGVPDKMQVSSTEGTLSGSSNAEDDKDENVGNKGEDVDNYCEKKYPEADCEIPGAEDTKKGTICVLSGSRDVENAKNENFEEVNCESGSIGKTCSNFKRESQKAMESFRDCQRIIRLDAVRMNAEWVPYSPTQASVTDEVAFELARNVGLENFEHLEPCRQHHAARLVAILEAYALHDPETGYCQGMSDLLSPFVALLDEDYEAFWCFVQFMNTARFNFRSDEIGIRRQLDKISTIFKAGDPKLYSHLESIYAENCFFVYRMVVVLLRRELTFEQTISLWEVLWAEKRALSLSCTKPGKVRRKNFLTEDLLLFVIAAAICQRRKVVMNCTGLDEVLRECNQMSGHLDIWKLLRDARNLAYAARHRV